MAETSPRRRMRREAPEVRRQDLLDITVATLAELGPRGATGREICRRAGVSHGLLRHYFTNADRLLLETYAQLCDDFLLRFDSELSPDADDRWASLDRFFALLFSPRWTSDAVLGAWMGFWHLVRTNDEFRAVSDRFNERLRGLLATCARQLAPAGGDVSIEDRVSMLSAVMDGLWLEVCLAPDRTGLARAATLCSEAARRLLA